MGIEEIIQPAGEAEALDVAEEVAVEAAEAGDGVAEPLDQADEFPDTFDDEAPGEETPLIKHLREQVKAKTREAAELRRQVAPVTVARTKKPDLWDDCEGDPDRFEAALLEWKENESRADAVERARTAEQQNVAQSWQQELQSYKAKAQQLGKPDFDAAEGAVIAALSDAQQSTIVMAAKEPHKFIYALGRSPNRLAALAQITNPIKLAAEIARIEGGRMMARKEPANIDSPVQGSGRLSVESADKKEAALIKEVERTGDIDKLRAYRREQRQNAA